MTVQEWLKHEGIAMTVNEKVVTSVPVVIEHGEAKYAGWLWSDGLRTFAHNTAGSSFTLTDANPLDAIPARYVDAITDGDGITRRLSRSIRVF